MNNKKCEIVVKLGAKISIFGENTKSFCKKIAF